MNDRTAGIMKILAAVAVIILLEVIRLYAPSGDNGGAGASVQEETGSSDKNKQAKTGTGTLTLTSRPN